MDKYCCEIKDQCDINPKECPIAKNNKAISDYEAAKQKLLDVIQEGINKFFAKWDSILKRSDNNAE